MSDTFIVIMGASSVAFGNRNASNKCMQETGNHGLDYQVSYSLNTVVPHMKPVAVVFFRIVNMAF